KLLVTVFDQVYPLLFLHYVEDVEKQGSACRVVVDPGSTRRARHDDRENRKAGRVAEVERYGQEARCPLPTLSLEYDGSDCDIGTDDVIEDNGGELRDKVPSPQPRLGRMESGHAL